MIFVLVDRDLHATSCDVTGSARSFGQVFRIFKWLRWSLKNRFVHLIYARWAIAVGINSTVIVLMHHVDDCVCWILVLLPAASTRDRKVVDDTRTVFAGSKNVSHASLVNVEATQLGYLSLVLLSLVKLHVLRSTFNVSLQGLTLLGLGQLSELVLALERDRLLHAIARYQDFLIASQLFVDVFWQLWHRQLPLAPQRAI